MQINDEVVGDHLYSEAADFNQHIDTRVKVSTFGH